MKNLVTEEYVVVHDTVMNSASGTSVTELMRLSPVPSVAAHAPPAPRCTGGTSRQSRRQQNADGRSSRGEKNDEPATQLSSTVVDHRPVLLPMQRREGGPASANWKPVEQVPVAVTPGFVSGQLLVPW